MEKQTNEEARQDLLGPFTPMCACFIFPSHKFPLITVWTGEPLSEACCSGTVRMTGAIKIHLRRRSFFDKEKNKYVPALPLHQPSSSPTHFAPHARTTHHHGLHACEGTLQEGGRYMKRAEEGASPPPLTFAASSTFLPSSLLLTPPHQCEPTTHTPRTHQHRHRTALVATTIVVVHDLVTPPGQTAKRSHSHPLASSTYPDTGPPGPSRSEHHHHGLE